MPITRTVTIRHWFPILTFCPVNHLPDLVYASVTFAGSDDKELYAVRKEIRERLSHRKCFMEELAKDLYLTFPTAIEVTIRLAFNRHEVRITRTK